MKHLLLLALLTVLITTLTGCVGELMGADWQAAQADGEAARAAAEWARTHQVEAEAAAAAREAAAREQVRTLAIAAMLLVGVGTAAGLGTSMVWWSVMRARLVFADKFGLYPVVVGSMPATNLNEPGAQTARIAPGRQPYQVLPPDDAELLPAIPAPIQLDARQLQHLERLMLPAPEGIEHDTD
jgi:hypothetical protein